MLDYPGKGVGHGDELLELQNRLKMLEQENDKLRHEKNALLNSTSWAVTEPMRWVLTKNNKLRWFLSSAMRRVMGKEILSLEAYSAEITTPEQSIPQAFMAPVTSVQGNTVFLDFEWQKTARPCDVADIDDSRSLAAGFHTLKVFNAKTGEMITLIDFSSRGTGRQHVCYGFSYPEDWGMWTLGGRSSLLLNLPSGVEQIRIEIVGRSFEAAFDTVPVRVWANNTLLKQADFGLKSDLELEFDTSKVRFYKDSNSKNLSRKGKAKPDVSILILDYNKPGVTLASVKSILNSKTDLTYEIIVLENGSCPENVQQLKSFKLPVRIINLHANRFFGEGNNIAAEFARADTFLFLNNDAFLSDFVLDKLHDALSDKIGISGPLFTYPDDRIQEAGAFLKKSGDAVQRGKFEEDFDPDELTPVEPVDYISAACIMITRDDFFRLGGFDLRYDPAYYEDADLCLRLRALGKKTVLVSDARVIHIENATSSDPANKNIVSNVVERHKKIFLSRWQNWLNDRKVKNLPDLASFDPDIIKASIETRLSDDEINAVMSPFPLTHGGGERYLLASALAMSKDHHTAFVAPDEYSNLRLWTLLHELNLDEELAHKLYTLPEALWQSKFTQNFMLMGNELLPSRAPTAEHNLYHCQFPFPVELSNVAGQERATYLKGYQGIVVNSEFTRDSYAEAARALGLETPDIHVVYPPVQLLNGAKKKISKEPMILNVGRFHPHGHSKRQDVVLKGFLEARKKNPTLMNWKLVFCGMVPNEPAALKFYEHLCKEIENEPNIEINLAPSRRALEDIMYRSSIFVSATGFGVTDPAQNHLCEHFGITVVEAASAGCIPVVYNRGGPADISKVLGADFTFGTLDEMVEQLGAAAEMATDKEIGKTMRQNAEVFSSTAFKQKWDTLLAR